MSLVTVLQNYKTRFEQIVQAISNSATELAKAESNFKQLQANHQTLLGHQTEAQNIISVLTAGLDGVAPGSAVDKAAHVAEDVLNAVEKAEEALKGDESPAEAVPAQ